jgi:hypothetical protein
MMQLEGSPISTDEACRAAQVSRAGYYRFFDEHAPRQAETELRDRIQRVAAELQLQVAHFRRRRKLGSYHLKRSS